MSEKDTVIRKLNELQFIGDSLKQWKAPASITALSTVGDMIADALQEIDASIDPLAWQIMEDPQRYKAMIEAVEEEKAGQRSGRILNM